jgi:hypothetical protein
MIEHGFLIAIGIWVTLIGYRVVRVPVNAGSSHDRALATFRWCGPLIVIINVGFLVAAVLRGDRY